MDTALGAGGWLLGKVFTKLSDDRVAAYVDSLELGHNSEQIKAKLLHTQGLLHNAHGSNIGHNPALQRLLLALSKNADQAEDLLDEIHYFQIHDKLHGTNYATTQEPGPDMGDAVRHKALHAGSVIHHAGQFISTLFRSIKRPQPAPVEGEQLEFKRPRIAAAARDGGDDSAVADATNSAAADGDKLHFDRLSVSRKIKSVLHVMQTNCDYVSNLLGSIPTSSSTAVGIHRPQIGSTIIQDKLYGRESIFEEIVNRITSGTQTVSVLPIVGPGGIGKTTFTQHLYIVFHSVKSLGLDVSHLTSNSLSKLLNCFLALSKLEITCSDPDHDYEEFVIQFPSSSSLQKLMILDCKSLVLVPVENGGIQEDNSSLQSFVISRCGKLFCRWPMGESGGGAQTIYPFPASLRELSVLHEPSMKSMDLLSNLTSLTRLMLENCSNLTVDRFNPLITLNLKELEFTRSNTVAADVLSEVARTKLFPAGSFRLEILKVDNISGLLVAPICNLLAAALHTLRLADERAESFTEEQEKALQLLTSLQILKFFYCNGLQSLPQWLHRLSSLEELNVTYCPKIRSIEGLPVSLRKLAIFPHIVEIDEQIEKFEKTNPDCSLTLVASLLFFLN